MTTTVDTHDSEEYWDLNHFADFVRHNVLTRQVQGRIIAGQRGARGVLQSLLLMVDTGEISSVDDFRSMFVTNGDPKRWEQLRKNYIQFLHRSDNALA